MTRTAITLAALLALVAVLVATTSAQTPLAYTPLTSGFQTLGVPGWSGDHGTRPAPSVSRTPTPSPSTSQTPKSSPSATQTPKPPAGTIRPPVIAVRGSATWYSRSPGGAAAAARLRDYLGSDWRGEQVTVCAVRCIRVRLDDYESSLIPGRLIDLAPSNFEQVCGPLSKGVCDVEVSRP